MSDRIELRPAARELLLRLRDEGYEAYVVGGCVRDALRGVSADDWDICTSALPSQTESVFSHCKTLDIGKKHGTVAVLFDGAKYEITTFRRDGGYEDSRHPTSVSFDASLLDDLSRRDFTINAMAADQDGLVTDPFNGRGDLASGVIRCVGDPDTRFSEDALRILRGLRFASTLGGFELHPDTADAGRRLAHLIGRISGERILTELQKLLCGIDCERILMDYPDILSAAIPEIAPCVGFEHRNSWHCYDVWEHIVRSIVLAPPDPVTRLALLFHDLAKPQCALDKPNGRRSFHGHPEQSAEMAKRRLTALHASGALREEICRLVLCHDDPLVPEPGLVGRCLRRFGAEGFFRLCDVQLADALAHDMDNPNAAQRPKAVEATRKLAQQYIAQGAPYSPAMLDIHGDELSVPPSQRGRVLERLCDDVLEGTVENVHSQLLERSKSYS